MHNHIYIELLIVTDSFCCWSKGEPATFKYPTRNIADPKDETDSPLRPATNDVERKTLPYPKLFQGQQFLKNPWHMT